MNEQLELIDLGDAMTETKCWYPLGAYYDNYLHGSYMRC